MDDQHVQFVIVGRGVSAKTLETGDVRLEGVLDVGSVPLRRLGLVKSVKQIAVEFKKLDRAERLREV